MEPWIQEEFESIRDSAFETRTLRMNRKRIRRLDWIPTRCEELQLQENFLQTLPELSNTVKYLNVSNNNLTQLPELLPQRLVYLNVSNNPNLTTLPELPDTLEVLIASNCGLATCPALPKTLKYLYLQNNFLKELPDLPPQLEIFYIYNNCIPDVSKLTQPLRQCFTEPQST